jgi:hypothetical protein
MMLVLSKNQVKTYLAIERRIVEWMHRKGYATGHGDTIEDLLDEKERS